MKKKKNNPSWKERWTLRIKLQETHTHKVFKEVEL